ncbi:hypothetical protein ACF05W_03220 [Streptomyces lydicus]|uniref:hypothetical protein n=1 Tax=Streptomyces lydicus TaxID=47763 RepID=UPI0036FB332B
MRIELHWTPGLPEVRALVRNASDLVEHQAFTALLDKPMPEGTVSDGVLDSLAAQMLRPYEAMQGTWTTDPVSVAAYVVKTWGLRWVPEKLAKRAEKGT